MFQRVLLLLVLIASLQCIEVTVREKVHDSSIDDEKEISLKATTQKCAYGTVPYEQVRPNGTSSANNVTLCDVCGETFVQPNPRIVGGIEAREHSWPAQVYIVQAIRVEVRINNRLREISQSFVCGGTIINRYTILTAAHCITQEFDYNVDGVDYTITLNNPFEATMFTVYVGAHDLTFLRTGARPIAPTVKMSVRKVIRHAEYNKVTFLNDIALYLLSQPVEFNNYVKPACLPDPSYGTYPPSNTAVYASGWGTLKEQGSQPTKLQNVLLTAYTPDKCVNVNRKFEKNWLSQMCAGEMAGGKDTCQGDSGGGLMVYDSKTKKYIVSGITSYGEGCANVGKPGIYTRTSYYYDWITRNWATNAYSNTAATTTRRSLIGSLLNTALFFKILIQ